MKRFLPPLLTIAALVSSFGASGCGYFTNIPAQISVAEVKPGRVTYEPAVSGGTITTKVEDPSVTLRAEPGSIGATYNSMVVTYYRSIDQAKLGNDTLPPMQIGYTFRVESSNYPSNPMDPAKPLVGADVGKNVYVGQATITPPIMTRLVEQYGAQASGTNGNQPGIFAMILLKGSDDANFDSQLTFWVPITFSGRPQ